MPRRTWGEIEEIARRLKRQLGIDDLWCPDLISVLDRLATVYPGLSVERLLDSELPDCEAQADCFEKKISIRESTYQACLRGDPRARMTVAHEIGHIALGHSGTRLRSVVLQVRRASTRVRDDEESEAIYFAGVSWRQHTFHEIAGLPKRWSKNLASAQPPL